MESKGANEWRVGQAVQVLSRNESGFSIHSGVIVAYHGCDEWTVAQQNPYAPLGTPVVRISAHTTQLRSRVLFPVR